MNTDQLHFFRDELEKLASSPWDQNPGAFGDVAAELGNGDGFSVADLRRYLGRSQSRSAAQRSSHPMWSRGGAENWLIRHPHKHRDFVTWSKGA